MKLKQIWLKCHWTLQTSRKSRLMVELTSERRGKTSLWATIRRAFFIGAQKDNFHSVQARKLTANATRMCIRSSEKSCPGTSFTIQMRVLLSSWQYCTLYKTYWKNSIQWIAIMYTIKCISSPVGMVGKFININEPSYTCGKRSFFEPQPTGEAKATFEMTKNYITLLQRL